MINELTKTERISDGERILQLSHSNQALFNTQDLATLWRIKNRNTLRVVIARYIERGLLHRIWRGLYSIQPLKNIHPWKLGQKIANTYCYISCETILFNAGIINQKPQEITLVSNFSKKFTALDHHFRVRQMKDELLYDNTGIIKKEGVYVANTQRAKKDLTYFNPKKYYDANF